MKILLVFSLIVSAALSNPVQENTQSKRHYEHRGRPCFTPEGTFSHGEHVKIRQNPCMEYMCRDGYLQAFKSGCPNDGRCRGIGETWKARDCHTYRCRATGRNSVEIKRIQSGCPDAYRQCRSPGERFPYEKNGRISLGCTCSTTPSFISYECPAQ